MIKSITILMIFVTMKKGVNPPNLSSSNKSLKIQKLENFIAKNYSHLFFKGLYGSSKSFFINEVFKNFDSNIFWILDNKEDVLVLDTRNEYETRVGKFENAIDLNLDTFRDFPKAIESLPEEYKDKQIVMYCTGGIRCEKASAVMMKAGFADVKQLDGGVLDYFKETGGAYWEGDCFVFDERVALDTELNETDYIYCYICREPLSAEEKASPDFKINEYCPYCVKKTV